MKDVIKKILCFVGWHAEFRRSRFHDWHCFWCGKFTREAITYDNGHVDPHYTGWLYKEDAPDKLYKRTGETKNRP